MSNSDSPLHLAIRNNNIEIAKVLLESQCEIHAVSTEGMTPLQLATQTGNAEMVALLLKYGAGSNPKTSPPPVTPKQTPRTPPSISVPIPPATPTSNPFEGLGPATSPFVKVDPKILKWTAYAYIGLIGGAALMPLNVNLPSVVPEITIYISYGVFVFLMYQFWNLIPRDIARTTPNKAAWFSLIPLFTFYWIFVCVRGFGQDLNKTLQQHGMEPTVNDSLQLTYCVCAIVEFVLTVLIGLLQQQEMGRPGALVVYIFIGLASARCMAIYNLYTSSKPLVE